MTENQSPLEGVLDVLVYAPVGLALTAVEEIPKLAAKGRAQVQGQWAIARMVGQFAVSQGRREVEKRLGGKPVSAPSEPAPSVSAPSVSAGSGERRRRGASGEPTVADVDDDDGFDDHSSSGAFDPDGGYGRMSGGRTETDHADEGGPGSGIPGVPGDLGVPGVPGDPEAIHANGLAIPGYDSLSASQVVQRLAGLSQAELDAVGAYESAHRGRRTILTRVSQLKA